MEALLNAEYDAEGKVTDGIMKTSYYMTDGAVITKEQRLKAVYLDENTMRVIFEGHDEPWAHLDAWQEYRLDNGKLTWEVRRNLSGAPEKK